MVTIKIFVDEVNIYTYIYRDQLRQSDINLHMILRNKVFSLFEAHLKFRRFYASVNSRCQHPPPQANPQVISLM